MDCRGPSSAAFACHFVDLVMEVVMEEGIVRSAATTPGHPASGLQLYL
jgi:hypothetical protein